MTNAEYNKVSAILRAQTMVEVDGTDEALEDAKAALTSSKTHNKQFWMDVIAEIERLPRVG